MGKSNSESGSVDVNHTIKGAQPTFSCATNAGDGQVIKERVSRKYRAKENAVEILTSNDDEVQIWSPTGGRSTFSPLRQVH